ncbi:MAG: efflux transporter outer membrane subunit [Deltaproteobacteria bacterium]
MKKGLLLIFALIPSCCRLPATALLCLTVAACAPVGPDFHPPDYHAKQNWHTELGAGLSAETASPLELSQWWANFNDPVLSDLIDRAVAGNLDLQQAYARLREARARLGVSRAGEFPALNSSGSATRSHSNRQSQSLYNIGFDAGWELDIFGGVRRSVEAARDDLAASREDLRDVLVSLLGEVATNYIEARTSQARLIAANANIKAQEDTYQLTSWRYKAGLSDELAVQQAQYNLSSTRAQLPALRTALEASLNRLAVLIGEEPGQVHDLLKKVAPIPAPPVTIAVGVPAEALRQRPDVRRAEQELAAATARIGVATADLYPKFQLSGSIGLESIDSADILGPASRVYRLGPSFSWPIFDAGQIRSNIEVQSALEEQKLGQYRGTLLSALEEVENSLTSYSEEQRRHQSLTDAARAARTAANLAMNKYQAGLVDFSTVLDAQRSRLSFDDQLAQSQGTVSTDLVRLYKALGGGWQSLAPDPGTSPSANKEQHQ